MYKGAVLKISLFIIVCAKQPTGTDQPTDQVLDY